jgi:hypothetical protein
VNPLAGVWIVSVGPKVLWIGLVFPIITELVVGERVNVGGATTVKVTSSSAIITRLLLSTAVTFN